MATFGLEVMNDFAHAKIQEIRTRLLLDDFLKNPFTSKVVLVRKDFYVVSITPVYPRMYLFAIFPLFLWGLFPDRWFGVVAAVIFFAMAFFGLWWWDKFYYLLFFLATKKGVRFVSASQALERVV